MKSIELLFRKFNKELYRYVYWLCKNKETSEDIVQESFIILSENKEVLSLDEPHIKYWLIRVSRNKTIDYFRKISKNSKSVVSLEGLEEMLHEESSLEKELNLSELHKLLNLLSPTEREIIYLKHILGYKIKEISEISFITIANVKSILHRSIKKLQNIVNK